MKVKNLTIIISSWLILFSLVAIAQTSVNLKSKSKHHISVAEPSDICLSYNKNSFFIVSDEGRLYETDLQGNITKTSNLNGDDFEGVYADEQNVYVIDETARKLYMVNATSLELAKTIELPYSGEANKGAEGITFSPTKKLFLIPIEMEPTMIREYDLNFNLIAEKKVDGAKDISSIQIYNNQTYLLSDEDHKIMQVDDNYKIIKQWTFNIINAEGFCFDNEGNLIVVSDEMEMMFCYDKLNN